MVATFLDLIAELLPLGNRRGLFPTNYSLLCS